MQNINLNHNLIEQESIQDKLIKEKIFSHSHIHSIYILFCNLCKENDYNLTRADLNILFKQLFLSQNIPYNEDKIDLFYLQMDINKDCVVNFQDFLVFITKILKLVFNELYPKNGMNSIRSLYTKDTREYFLNLNTNLFLTFFKQSNGNNNILNPFTFYDFSVKFFNFHKYYCEYKSGLDFNKYYNSDTKLNEFNEMLSKFNDFNFVRKLQNLLNSQNTKEYYEGLSLLKKSIKPLNYVNNCFIIIYYINNIFNFITVLIKSSILDKVLMIFNILNNNKNQNDSNTISPEVIYTFLTIIKRFLHLFSFINEIYKYAGENENKFFMHYIKEQNKIFNELVEYMQQKIFIPLNENMLYFYRGFVINNSINMKNKIKFTIYKLFQILSKLELKYFSYFINDSFYMQALLKDVEENCEIFNKNNNGNSSQTDEKKIMDFDVIENVIYNCINIIDILLKYISINNNNFDSILINNIYISLTSIANNLQNIVFINNSNNILKKNNIQNQKNDFNIKSMYLCLLGTISFLNFNNNNNNISKFDDHTFILRIYNNDFKTKYKDLIIPFNFYIRSLIMNKRKIIILVTELDILNNIFEYYSINQNTKFFSFSSFLDYCELLLLTNENNENTNSNIINAIITILLDKLQIFNINNNNNSLIEKEIKNFSIYIISKIIDFNNVFINETILSKQNIFPSIILYLSENIYYFEEIADLQKKSIVFNILLLYNGLNILYKIIHFNSNSYQKIFAQLTVNELKKLTQIFTQLSELWDVDEEPSENYNKELIKKNKYIFDKYKDIPPENALKQIFLIFTEILDLKEKYKIFDNHYIELYEYIDNNFLNMRERLQELKIISDKYKLKVILFSQNEEEIKQGLKSRFDFEDIDQLTFNSFLITFKEGYKSNIEISYLANGYTRYIRNDNEFGIFIDYLKNYFENSPNKENIIVYDVKIKLIFDKQKFTTNCIQCHKEIEIEIDISKIINDFSDLSSQENLNLLNQKINEETKKALCENCKKYSMEKIINQINIGNSQNRINEISYIENLNNSFVSSFPQNNNINNNLFSNSVIGNDINTSARYNINNSVNNNINNNSDNIGRNLFGSQYGLQTPQRLNNTQAYRNNNILSQSVSLMRVPVKSLMNNQ